MYYTGVRDGKMEKMVKLNLSILVFSPTINLATLRCIRNLKTLALIETEKSVTENLIGEKEKWTNKGNGKHQEADSLLHNATFVPSFIILGAVVLEKSLTQMSLCITPE